jgi:hypothetical protein
MALHEVEIADGIIDLEFKVYILTETLNFLLKNVEISNLELLDEAQIKREAFKYIKEKYPDEDIKAGDFI